MDPGKAIRADQAQSSRQQSHVHHQQEEGKELDRFTQAVCVCVCVCVCLSVCVFACMWV